MYKVGMGHKPPIPERLSPEGKDFLCHCLESEPRMRWTASQLLDHSFVKVWQTAVQFPPCLNVWVLSASVTLKTLGNLNMGHLRPYLRWRGAECATSGRAMCVFFLEDIC